MKIYFCTWLDKISQIIVSIISSVSFVCSGFPGILGRSGDLENDWTYQSEVFSVGYSGKGRHGSGD